MSLSLLLALTTIPALANPPQTATLQPINKHWLRVEAIAAGESIVIRDKTLCVDTSCLLDYANDSVLACHSASTYSPQGRMVYKREQLDRVWVERLEPGTSPLLIPSIITFGILGAALGSIAGPAGIAAGALLGGPLGSSFQWLYPGRATVRRHRIFAGD